jgi:very-short-patch-repair endonuclease
MKRLDKEQYIKSCIDKHNGLYDYSLVEYEKISSKISIICKKHGIFNQIAKNHREGQGCPLCSGRLILNKSDYLKKFNTIKYDYSLVEDGPLTNDKQLKIIDINTGLIYIQSLKHHKNGRSPSKIEANSLINRLMKIHNDKYYYIIEKEIYNSTDKIKIVDSLTDDIFYYRVDRHLSGMKPNKVTLNYFLIKSKSLHNDKYDYSLVNRFNSISDKVDIICKEHGVFKQRISNHMNLKDGCPKCVGVGKWNTDLLKYEFIEVHRNNFDYSKVKFENIDKKVEIVCREHGTFYQNIHKHLSGQGCRFCESKSKGEDYIKMWLDELSISYKRQHSFETCRYINKLSFDFYLSDYNMCIEFDGKQHFEPVEHFGGEEGYKTNIKRDNVKNKWCLDNNIQLVRIKYNEVNKIKYILKEKLQIVDIK